MYSTAGQIERAERRVRNLTGRTNADPVNPASLVCGGCAKATSTRKVKEPYGS